MNGARRHRASLAGLAVAVLAFVYRFNTLGGGFGGFDNDHFAQLVRAVDVAGGGLPLRDFADAEFRGWWPPLTYYASAGAQLLCGPSLLSEAWLTVGALAVGAGLTCWLAARACGSEWAASAASLMAVALEPRLYNYPKILVAALMLAAQAAYVRCPSRLGVAGLAAVTLAAGLWRHDLGLLCAVGTFALLWLIHGWRGVWKISVLPLYVTIVVVGLLPGLVFVLRYHGLGHYIRDNAGLALAEGRRTTHVPRRPVIDWNAPLLGWAQLPPAPVARINVRWPLDMSVAERAAKERELGLTRGLYSEGTTWGYDLEDPSPANIQRLLREPSVQDTHGVDPRTYSVTNVPSGLWVTTLRRRYRWLRIEILPGVLRSENAGIWLYALAWVLPLFTAVWTASWLGHRGSTVEPDHRDRLVLMFATAVFALAMNAVLLRDAADRQLPDAAIPAAVVGACWLAGSIRWLRQRHSVAAVSGMALVLAGVLLTGASVAAIGELGPRLDASGFTGGPRSIRTRWLAVVAQLAALPANPSEIRSTSFSKSIEYLRACTAPTDRLLVGDNAPWVNYFAERGFAAGHVAFFSGFYTSTAKQQTALARLKQQSVPIVLLQTEGRFAEEFGSDYPLLAAHVAANYRRVKQLDVGNNMTMDVYVDKSRVPVTTYEPLGLPCFRPSHSR